MDAAVGYMVPRATVMNLRCSSGKLIKTNQSALIVLLFVVSIKSIDDFAKMSDTNTTFFTTSTNYNIFTTYHK